MKRFIIIDIETTGQNKRIHDIIQLGAVKLDNECNITDKFTINIKPLNPNYWSIKAEEIHKMSKEYILQNGIECNKAFEEFEKWVGNPKEYYLSAWGVYFDINFLVEQYEKINRPYPFSYRTLDVASVVRFYLTVLTKKFPGEEKAAKLLDIELEENHLHNGLYDAEISAKMLKEVFNRIKNINKI